MTYVLGQFSRAQVITDTLSFPRYSIVLIYNGNVSNGDFLTYSNTIPNTDPCVPVKSNLKEVTWVNSNTNVSFDIEFRKNGRTTTPFYTYQTRNNTDGRGIILPNVTQFIQGDCISLKYIDQGTNCQDMAVTLFFQAVE